MILLQAGFESQTWSTADVITIVTILISGGSVWLKLIVDKTKMQSHIDTLKADLDKEKNERKEDISNVIAAKSTIKFELNKKLDVENQKIHDRITKTQEHHEKSMKNVATEFKAINLSLGEIQTGIARIEGKLGK